MRRNDLHEFAGGDDFRFLPERGEMADVAGNKIVGACGVGAFDEDVVAGIAGDLKWVRGSNQFGATGDELKELNPQAFADAKFRTREDGSIFEKDRRGDEKAGGLGESEDEDSALESVGLKSGGNNYVGVEDEAKREHWAGTDESRDPPLQGSAAFGIAGASRANDLVDLPLAEIARTVAFCFDADKFQHLGFRCRQPDVIPDTE
jgi:hypothetical protein